MLSLRSGSGLDGLQGTPCSAVVYGELDWSPQVHRQTSGRLHRDGQIKPILAYYLVAQSGIDPIMLDVLGVKRQQALGIEDPHNVDLQPVTDRSRAVTIARRYLESIGHALPDEMVSTAEVDEAEPPAPEAPC